MSSHFLQLSDEDLLAEASRLLADFSRTSLTILQSGKLSQSSRTYLVSALIRASSEVQTAPSSVSFTDEKYVRVIKAPEMRPWNDPSYEQAFQNYLERYEAELREQVLNLYNATIMSIYPDPDRLALFQSNPSTYDSFGLAMLMQIDLRGKDDTEPSLDVEEETVPSLINIDMHEGIVLRDVEPQNTGWRRPAQVAAGSDWNGPTSVVETFGEGQAKDVIDVAFGGYLTLQDLGIEIPDGATILGIEVEVMRSFFGSGIENLDEEIDVVQCRRVEAVLKWGKVEDILELNAVDSVVSMDGTHIAVIDSVSDSLRRFALTGGNWVLDGVAFQPGYFNVVAATAMNDTDVAVFSQHVNEIPTQLGMYRFAGGSWSLVGNPFTPQDFAANSTNFTISSIPNSTDVVLSYSHTPLPAKCKIKRLSFDGTDWTQVSSDLSIEGAGSTLIVTALNETDIAVISYSLNELYLYRLEAGSYSQIGSPFDLVDSVPSAISAFPNGTDLAIYSGGSIDKLRTVRFDYDAEVWSLIGEELEVLGGFDLAIDVRSETEIFLSPSGSTISIYEFVESSP